MNAKSIGNVSNELGKQIKSVNLFHWAVLPSLIGVLLCFLIVFIWSPVFSGTYKYYDCPAEVNSGKRGSSRRKNYDNCELKDGSLLKRNILILLVIFTVIPAIFAGIGYRIGFAISNPKLYTGIYATGFFMDQFR